MIEDVIRRAIRRAVVMEAQCRTASGTGKVSLVDLTAEGCCIFARGLILRANEPVRLTPQAFDTLPGTVRWIARGYAGIAFDRPRYGPVAEHLQATFAALGSVPRP